MATRYWVGGTGNWDATTTNWSATSGGAGGASVPTSADDVVFDNLSNATAYVCTLTTAPTCRSVTVAGPAAGNVTIAGSTLWVIYGGLTIAATGVTWTYSSNMFFSGSTPFSITTNGVSLTGGVAIQGTSTYTLGSALTCSGVITLTQGTLSTANFNITTTNNFVLTGASARTINLGSSTVTCASWNALAQTNLTLNAGTSTISVTGAAGTFNGGGLTYYNLSRTVTSPVMAIGDGGNTFTAITNSATAFSASYQFTIAGNQTIGTFTVNGGSTNASRVSIQTPGSLSGTQITLTVASFVTNGRVDFRDINWQGASSPLTVATGGDCGNNTNITLQTPKTVYWNLVGGGNWDSTAWSLTSGGTPLVANFPLPQDTIIIQDTGLNSGATITENLYTNIGTVDMSTRTLPMTFAASNTAPYVYGDLKFSSSVTTTSTTATWVFSGYNKTQTITSAGITVAFGITVNGLSTTVALAGALTTTAAFTLTLGTLNLANNNLTCNLFSSNITNTRVITFGTGGIYITGNNTNVWSVNSTNLTYTGTPNVYLTYSGATGTRLFTGGASTYPFNFYITAGTDIITLPTSSFVGTLNFTGFSGSITTYAATVSVKGDLVLSAAMTFAATNAGTFVLSGTGTQNITFNGKEINSVFALQGSGSFVLQGNLSINTTYYTTHSNGALDLNGYSITGNFITIGATARSIAFNNGSIIVNTSGATAFQATGSNLTTTGPGTINMTSASSKTFAGGGFSYPTLNQGGAGTLTITGANTFANMTNTVQPCTITFPASTTTTCSNFNVNGTAGNLVTLNSSVPGTRFTLLKV